MLHSTRTTSDVGTHVKYRYKSSGPPSYRVDLLISLVSILRLPRSKKAVSEIKRSKCHVVPICVRSFERVLRLTYLARAGRERGVLDSVVLVSIRPSCSRQFLTFAYLCRFCPYPQLQKNRCPPSSAFSYTEIRSVVLFAVAPQGLVPFGLTTVIMSGIPVFVAILIGLACSFVQSLGE